MPTDILGVAEGQKPAPARIYLPSPDGRYIEFIIRESQIMAPALAAEFPEIKTYRGYAADNNSVTVTVDFTPKGFHAQVLEPGKRWFIDPKFKGNVNRYISYFSASAGRGGEQCLVEGVSARNPIDGLFEGLHRSGDLLRSYRLAVAATGEYTQFHGGTVADGMAAIVTTINRVIGIYEKELSITFTLVGGNSSIVFSDPATDPFTGNNNPFTLINESQLVIDSAIGSANYDIGHTFSTGAGGLASLGIVCSSSSKARGVTGLSNPSGDPFDVDFVAHEIGHQFGGNHTFNGSLGNCSGSNRNGATAYEPGSGSTIQAYAGICSGDNLQSNSDAIFHSESHVEMISHVTTGSGASCGTIINTSNNIPSVNAGPNYTIPVSTPFVLKGSATDADGNALTYLWEQRDLGPQAPLTAADDGQIPLFRVLTPTAAPVRYLPELADLASNIPDISEKLPVFSRTMQWRLTARDNLGGVESDDMQVVVAAGAGPFFVSSPNGGEIVNSGTYNVTWDVAGTNVAPVSASSVNIYLSTDGGLTFDFANPLATNVPNDGSQTVSFPNIVSATTRVLVEASNNIFFDTSDENFFLNAGPSGQCLTGAPNNIFSEDWESGNTNNWVQVNTTGTNSWSVSTVNPDQGLSHLHANNPDTTSDTTFQMVTANNLASDSFLSIRHHYDFEPGWDGGVIEISTDNGGTWLDLSTLDVISGNYNDVLNSGNPLAGQDAFSGNSSGYVSTLVDLVSLTGSDVQVRFRVVTDAIIGATGWDIDEVSIYSCQNQTPKFCAGSLVTVDIAAGQAPTPFDDVILGTVGPDTIFGLGGDDLICAGNGNDIVFGGNGDDVIYAGALNDVVHGGNGADTIWAGTGDDRVFGGTDQSADYIYGQNGADELYDQGGYGFTFGGGGNDTIYTGTGGGYISGGNNADTLVGSNFVDVIYGQDGADIITGSGADDFLYGGNSRDDIDGGGGDDTISGGAFNDTLVGGAGNDTIDGGTANDSIFGGAGNDILGGGVGNDELFGGAGSDTLNGGPDNDVLNGQADTDVCNGGTGADIVTVTCESSTGIPRAQVQSIEPPDHLLPISPISERILLLLDGCDESPEECLAAKQRVSLK